MTTNFYIRIIISQNRFVQKLKIKYDFIDTLQSLAILKFLLKKRKTLKPQPKTLSNYRWTLHFFDGKVRLQCFWSKSKKLWQKERQEKLSYLIEG